MASALARAKRPAAAAALAAMAVRRAFASVAVGSDIVSAAPGVSLQKARSWDEGVSSKFSTTPLTEIFQVPTAMYFNFYCVENYLNLTKFSVKLEQNRQLCWRITWVKNIYIYIWLYMSAATMLSMLTSILLLFSSVLLYYSIKHSFNPRGSLSS